jgi:hypothetical protein
LKNLFAEWMRRGGNSRAIPLKSRRYRSAIRGAFPPQGGSEPAGFSSQSPRPPADSGIVGGGIRRSRGRKAPVAGPPRFRPSAPAAPNRPHAAVPTSSRAVVRPAIAGVRLALRVLLLRALLRRP